MKATDVIIGLDIGTTSAKTVVFNVVGKVQAKHEIGYPIIHPQPSWAEQDPDVIVEAAIDSMQKAIHKAKVLKEDIITVGISSAMHSLIAIDTNNLPLTNSIIWADNRSIKQTFDLKNNLDGHDIYLRTGTPLHPMSPLPKLLWMKENQQDIFRNAHKFISIKEYLTYKLFHEYVIDYSIASATGLFNIYELEWDKQALKLLELNENHLSKPVPTTYVFKDMDKEIAERIGISTTTPFVIGASDGVLANLGVGAINVGEVAVTIGTSGAIRTVTNKPKTDEKGRTFCYALTENHWVIGGPTNNGGIALRWIHDEFAQPEMALAKELGTDSYNLVMELAETISAGSEGLLFLPFLSGERAPYWNANARGTFFGVSLQHKREHFFRAVLEGVIFSVHSVGVVLEELSGEKKAVLASGGFAKSPLWRQILSDVMGLDVIVPESHEASALGAAFLALYSLGEVENLHEIKKWLHFQHIHEPVATNHEIYKDLFQIYNRLYSKLEDEFEEMAAFQKKYRTLL